MKYTLSVIWLIFTILFLLLGKSHWIESQNIIPPFELTQREMDKPSSSIHATITIKGTELDKPLKDFTNEFNSYLEKQNQSSHKANRNAAWGYFLASLAALISMLLEWRDDFSKLIKKIKQKS